MQEKFFEAVWQEENKYFYIERFILKSIGQRIAKIDRPNAFFISISLLAMHAAGVRKQSVLDAPLLDWGGDNVVHL